MHRTGDATLVLVRHGETTWVAEGRFQGSADPPLSDSARSRQPRVARAARPTVAVTGPAPAAGRAAADLALAPGPGRLHGRRPSRRPREPSVALTADAGLVELAQGDWEGQTGAEVSGRWPSELAAWRTDPRITTLRAASRCTLAAHARRRAPSRASWPTSARGWVPRPTGHVPRSPGPGLCRSGRRRTGDIADCRVRAVGHRRRP